MREIIQISTLLTFLILGNVMSYGQASNLEDDQSAKKLSPKKILELQESADSLYADVAFMESAKQYEELEYNAALDVHAKAKLAESYRCNAEYEKAEYWYKQYIKEDSDPETCLNFARVLQANDKCEEASVWYKRYLTHNPVDADDITVLTDCENLKSITFNEDVMFFNVDELNTAASEYSMIELNDQLLFTSNRELNKVAKHEDLWTNGEFSDLFVVNPDDFGTYSRPSRIKGKVNMRFHDGVAVFDKNEYRLYFTRNERKAKNDKVRELKIYSAKVADDGTWYDVQKLSINTPGFSSCHPAISEDGKSMIFSSNRPGGIGGMDLFFTQKDGDSWSTPIHMGSEINSTGNEIFPHLANDGALFFASNGHVGLGGLDVFRVKLGLPQFDAKSAYEVQNIGKPFNSIKDDFAFVSVKGTKSGYMASNRAGGKGKDDIYRWILNSDDPLVLDFYKKSLCLEEIYDRGSIEDATMTVLEFATTVNFKEEVNPSQVLTGFDESTLGIIINILSLKKTKLVDKQTFDAGDPAFEYLRMKPNRDYLIVAQKEGFFDSQKFVTSRENESEYLNCIELSLEPYRVLQGTVAVEDNPDDKGPTSINLYNHCIKEIEKIPVALDGTFTHKLKCKCEYDISVDHRDYEYYKKHIEAFKNSCEGAIEEINIKLKSNSNPFEGKVKLDALITLNNIFYEYDEFVLSAVAKVELDHLVKTMRDNPTMKVQLTAHTDSRGKAEYNLILSEKRAWSAAQYVISAGIQADRITYQGKGETMLINECDDKSKCSEEQHQVNRRTEVLITSI